ncbi:MAG: DUF4124 domain-containing protein [Pseudomonadota bacterium]
MFNKIVGICAAAGLLAFGLANNAQAQIYKWVDENGVVHYADQPQSDDAVQSEIRSARTDTAAAKERLRASLQQNNEQNERLLAGPTDEFSELDPAEAERMRELRRQSCEAARNKLKSFTEARRLYTLAEDGSKVYLDEEGTLAARAEAQAAVTEFCE